MLITKTSIRSDHENAVFLFLFIKYYRRCNSAFQGIKRSLLFAEINVLLEINESLHLNKLTH